MTLPEAIKVPHIHPSILSLGKQSFYHILGSQQILLLASTTSDQYVRSPFSQVRWFARTHMILHILTVKAMTFYSKRYNNIKGKRLFRQSQRKPEIAFQGPLPVKSQEHMLDSPQQWVWQCMCEILSTREAHYRFSAQAHVGSLCLESVLKF